MSNGQAIGLATTLACKLCGCGESGSGASSGGIHPIGCCPGTYLPETIYATITGGTAIDGDHTLTYTEDASLLASLFIYSPSAWVKTWTYQFSCPAFPSGTNDYYYALLFGAAEACSLIWWQQQRQGVRIGTTAGKVTTCEITPVVCDPFDFYWGIGASSGTILKDCSTAEANNICVAPWTGPKVEITT